MTSPPRRALIVSADIGEGHNAAGRALAEAAGRAWPGCAVHWLDALDATGPGFARLSRRFYVTQVERLPRMYAFCYDAMWRHRWYLDSTRRGLGAWFGRRMAPHLRAAAPDVIISTYPLGSAGLSWLRRRGQLPMPAGAWVPAFCPHPSWLYPDLDITYLVHPAAAAAAARAEPAATIAVGALPVRDAFGPADQAVARKGLGVPPDRFTAALCTGSLAFGRVDLAVTALLAAAPEVQVIAVCGRNERLRRQLLGRGEPPGRLLVLGWTDDMPAVLNAADVVVTNGGGGTALEAVRTGRPVIMFQPIAGHGQANAELMARAGLARLAPDAAALTAEARRLAGHPGALAAQAAAARAAAARAAGRRREDDLARLAAMRGR
jgi:diacylglycerol O-acyltransferase